MTQEPFASALGEQDPDRRRDLLYERRDAITVDGLLALLARTQEAASAEDFDQTSNLASLGMEAAKLADQRMLAAAFELNLGIAHAGLGHTKEARELWLSARRVAEEAKGAGLLTTPSIWTAASLLLAHQCEQAGRLDDARAAYDEVRQRAYASGETFDQVLAGVALIRLTLESELDTAASYADLILAAMAQDEDLTGEVRASLAGSAVPAIVSVARAYYYERENWARAADFAKASLLLSPDFEAALFILGCSLMRLERFDEAAETWRRAVNTDPEHNGYRASLAGALWSTGQQQEAIKLLREVIAADPTRYRDRHYLARMLAATADHAGAVDTYDGLIGELAGVADQEAATSKLDSAVQYERDMPLRDVSDFARLERAQLLQALGRTDEAIVDMEDLAKHGDATMREYVPQFIEMLRGSACSMSATGLDDDRKLIAAQLDAGEFAEVLESIRAGTPRDELLAFIMQRLDAGPAVASENPDANKLLGYIAWQSYQRERADAAFQRAADQRPGDAQTFLWRGLNGVSTDGASSSVGLSPQDVETAIDHLVEAVRLAPNDEEARQACRWLLDRVMSNDAAFPLAMRPGLVGPNPVLPALATLLQEVWTTQRVTHELEARHQWRESLEALHSLQASLMSAGFKVSATSLYLRLADNSIRLNELQRALNYLDAADGYLALFALGPSEGLVDEIVPRGTREKLAHRPKVYIQIEYMPVLTLADRRFGPYSALLRAQALSRLGDSTGALEALGNPEQFLEPTTGRPVTGLSFRSLTAVVQVLRDGGDLRNAVRLLRRARPWAEGPRDLIHAEATEASLWTLLDRHQKANACYGRMLELIDKEDYDFGPVVKIILAGNLLNMERYEDALRALDSVSIDTDARSLREKRAYHELVALSSARVGDIARARDAARQAIEIIESTRETLLGFDTREAWLGSGLTVDIYHLAIELEMTHGDVNDALRFTERIKSRALIDRIRTAAADLTGEAASLKQALDDETRLRDALRRLAGIERASDGELVDVEAQAVLTRLGISLSGSDADTPINDGERRRLILRELNVAERQIEAIRSRIAAERIEASQSLGGDADTEDLSAIRLALSECGERHVEPLVLVEYLCTNRHVYVFMLRPGSEAPVAKAIEVSGPELMSEVANHMAQVRGLTSDIQSNNGSSILEALVEPIVKHTTPEEMVCICPSGVLHLVAFHSLRVDGASLLDRNPVFYAPSAVAFAATARRPGRSGGRAALVVGDPRGDLPFARAEADTVGEMLGCQPLCGESATKTEVIRHIKRMSDELNVIHFACHGYFESSAPLHSGLSLAPPAAGVASGDAERSLLSAGDLLGLSLNANLVTLSACDTAVSEVHIGDELHGLAQTILHAGARSIIASLWQVSDFATSLTFRAFHTQADRETGTSIARALRDAQRATRDATVEVVRDHLDQVLRTSKSARIARICEHHAEGLAGLDASDTPFAHPRYWAPFVLIGDGRTRHDELATATIG